MNDLNHPASPTTQTNAAGLPLMICLLGNFRLLQAGELVSIRAGGKTEALLAHLALLYGRRAPRERLIQTLWPTSEPALALQSLNTLVYTLHQQFGPSLQDVGPILHEDGYYRLNIEAGIGIDITYFDHLAQIGDQQMRAGDTTNALIFYQRALEWYRGDLCLALDSQMIVERERLRERFLTLLAQLADYHYREHDYSACLTYLWHLLARDPGREDAHRQVMRCYVRRGERTAALRHYQVCVDLLRAEFDVAPEPATLALVEQIRHQPDQV